MELAILRFALLEHTQADAVHWDLLLEQDGRAGLVSWRLLDDPLAHDPVRAERMADHRKHYLDYEGPISGGRGVVRQVDSGQVRWSTPGELTFTVSGKCLNGEYILAETGVAGVYHLTLRASSR